MFDLFFLVARMLLCTSEHDMLEEEAVVTEQHQRFALHLRTCLVRIGYVARTTLCDAVHSRLTNWF